MIKLQCGCLHLVINKVIVMILLDRPVILKLARNKIPGRAKMP